MQLDTTYVLTDGVQVRKEVFGLLFYNYRGPRLYFLPSHDFIGDDSFDGKQTVRQMIGRTHKQHEEWPLPWIENKLREIVQMLEEKELIHGQPLC